MKRISGLFMAFFLLSSPALADWNGSGSFTRNQDFTADRDSGSPDNIISADKMDDEFDNIKSGLENTLTRDGQNSPSANLPMGGMRHTGVGVATARTDYARASQLQDGTLTWLGTSSGTDTITATAPLSMSAYATGASFEFKAGDTNTGATTLNLNAIGAKAIQKNGAALVAGDITANDVVRVVYDGTQFQMLSPARDPVLTTGSVVAADLAANSVTTVKILDANVTKAKIENVASMKVLGNVTGGATAPAEVAVLDEDNMASDSATSLATQQSIKAYVDSSVAWTYASVNTTSGTSVTVSNAVPATAEEIEVLFSGVSTNTDNQNLVLVLGDSGGLETTGYVSGVGVTSSSGNVNGDTSTSAYLLTEDTANDATNAISGVVRLIPSGSNTWHQAATLYGGNAGANPNPIHSSTGTKTLSATLTTISLTTAGGTATFDAGSIVIRYR